MSGQLIGFIDFFSIYSTVVRCAQYKWESVVHALDKLTRMGKRPFCWLSVHQLSAGS